MITKEEFTKRFPLKVHVCTVDNTNTPTCCIDEGTPWDCECTKNITKKEECEHWKEIPNWDYIQDIWEWIDNKQKGER
jgi:hypothetical protein